MPYWPLKFMEKYWDRQFGLRMIAGNVRKNRTVKPGGLFDLEALLDTWPGGFNAGFTRASNVIIAVKRMGGNSNIVSQILALNNGRAILRAKGPGRKLPDGINSIRQVDDALNNLRSQLGDEAFDVNWRAAEIIRDIYRMLAISKELRAKQSQESRIFIA